jgi:hypothetical protein
VTDPHAWGTLANMANVDDLGLAMFNKLSGTLQIKLSEATHALSERLMNQVASPSARIEQIGLELNVYENREFRDLTDAEWSTLVIRDAVIRMRGEGPAIVEHHAPSAAGFTVRDLADAIAKTEREGRSDTEWYGGIDTHHVFFEGIRDDDGVWAIRWGS